jgi:Ca-activated chloride channel family protein
MRWNFFARRAVEVFKSPDAKKENAMNRPARSSKNHRALAGIGSTLLALSALLALAFSMRVLPDARAQDGVSPPVIIEPPRPIPPIWPPRPFPPVLNQELQLVSQKAKVEINGALAKTHLTQTFKNTTNRRIEGTYLFPLPFGASVSGFAMTVNGKRMEAEFLEGDKAREIYQGIMAKLRDPALLEFVDRNLIRARIFPIEPGATQQMELEYSGPLRADNGSFRYVVPLRLPVGGVAERASVDIKIVSPDGVKAVYSPTHEIEVVREGDSARVTGEFGSAARRREAGSTPATGAARDFVLYYTTSRAKVGVNLITHREAGEDGTFMLLLAPDSQIAPEEIAFKDVVFVFDTSGSMSGEKIEQARKALLNLLGNLNANDRFNIVTFSSATRSFRDGLTTASPDVLKAAREWTQKIKAVGGTNINDALLESLKMMRDDSARAQQIVFMTDGQPTVGETNIEQILKNVRNAGLNEYLTAKRSPSERIFVFGVGYDVNTRLLDALAEENRGASDYVLPEEDIEEKVGALYNKIAFPVLSNPRLDWHGAKVYDVFPKVLPDIFKGAQTIVFGRFEAGSTPAAAPTLIGNIGGREERFPGRGDFSNENPSNVNDALPRLWATRKIGFLMDEARRANRTIDPEVKNEIIALGKKYGIVTPFTAGLITEDSDLTRPDFSRTLNSAAGQVAADAARGLSAPAAGEYAVKAARATKQYRSAETLPAPVSQSATTREIAGKTFELKNDVWTDTTYEPQKTPNIETIKFASPEYFALAKDARVAKWLSVGEKLIVVLGKRVIRIVE